MLRDASVFRITAVFHRTHPPWCGSDGSSPALPAPTVRRLGNIVQWCCVDMADLKTCLKWRKAYWRVVNFRTRREVCENSVPQSSFSNSLVCTLISFSLSPPACLCRYSFTRDFLVPFVKPLPFLDLAVSTSHPCVQSALMQLRDGGKVSRDGPTGVMSTSNKDRGWEKDAASHLSEGGTLFCH